MAATLYLVRHAAHARVNDTLCGRMPGVSLGEEGRRQAERVAERLAGEDIGAVFSSPLARAIETAKPIGRRLGLPVQVSEALNEIDFGAWTGRRFDDLADDPTWTAWNRIRTAVVPPGGERLLSAAARILAFAKTLAAADPDRGTVLVTHGDLIRTALCEFLDCRSLGDYALFEVGPGSVTRVALWPGGWRVMSVNEAVAA
jgi:probable phosphoglycerate mutase